MKKRVNNSASNNFRHVTPNDLKKQFIIGFLIIIFIIVLSFILMTNHISNLCFNSKTNTELGNLYPLNQDPDTSDSVSIEEPTINDDCQTDMDCGAVIDSDGFFAKFELFYKSCLKCEGIPTGAFYIPNPNLDLQIPVYKNGSCVVSPSKICAHSQLDSYCLDTRYEGIDKISFTCNEKKECIGKKVDFFTNDCNGMDILFSCKYGGTCAESDKGISSCIPGTKNKPEFTKCLFSSSRGKVSEGVCKSGKCMGVSPVI
ncbi:MAG: hypothetical protein WC867_05030 [Candidatus Pacearchaeota archaeon]|jgi:hypothetical protein